ncbi:hypothetical protein Dimus_013010 [Dionaea muscipula]
MGSVTLLLATACGLASPRDGYALLRWTGGRRRWIKRCGTTESGDVVDGVAGTVVVLGRVMSMGISSMVWSDLWTADWAWPDLILVVLLAARA